MQIVIFDPVAPAPYSASGSHEKPLGGTEATVVRIAEAMDAVVVQHNRIENEGRYRNPASSGEATHLVVLREAQAALEIAKRFPHAHKILWLHDLAAPTMDRGKKLLMYAPQLAAERFTLVCVSDFHAQQVRENFLSLPASQRPRVTRVYNPVDVSAGASQTGPFDPNKLVFFSSPHKGLEYATTIFAQLRAKNPDLRLYIANPGYLADAANTQPGVVNLGAVPHHIILEHVKSALCTFYPNYVYAETFGLALAESNALGTPVLTHGIGAAAEVLNGDGQIIDVPRARGVADSVFWHWPALRRSGEAMLGMLGCANAYGARIRDWQTGSRPVVSGRPEFSIYSVVAAWNEVHGARANLEPPLVVRA